MKKAIFIAMGILVVTILGFVAPPLIIPPSELRENYQSAVEPFGPFLLTAKILRDQDNNYANRCSGETARVLLQSYTWMLIPGPVIEACVFRNGNGEITGLKSIGTVAKR